MDNIKNRNLPDFEKEKEYNQMKKSSPLISREVLEERLVENLKIWENKITKHFNLPYIPNLAEKIRDGKTKRILIHKHSPDKNERIAYAFGKHFVNAGIAPSQISIVNLEDMYLNIRGFSTESRELKDSFFSPNNRVLIITGVQSNKETYSQDNVKSFWKEFIYYVEKMKGLHIIFSFDEYEKDKWIFKDKEILKRFNDLDFKSL